MTRWMQTLAVVGAWSMAGVFGFAQNPKQNPNPVQNQPTQDAGKSLRGKVVRVEGQNQIVVRTHDNKEVILMANPSTRYVIDGRASRIADLKAGVEINAAYTMQDNRYLVNSVQVGVVAEPNANAQPGNARNFRGRVVRVNPQNNQIVVKSQDGQEVTLYVQQNGRFLRNGQAVRLADIQVGTVITTQYVERDNHWWVEEVTIVTDNPGANPPAANPPAVEGTQIQGTVVRIVGQNQVIIRTADGKEVTVDLVPQTTYLFNDQPGQLRDIQPGHDVRIQYTTRDRRFIAGRVLGNRRN